MSGFNIMLYGLWKEYYFLKIVFLLRAIILLNCIPEKNTSYYLHKNIL